MRQIWFFVRCRIGRIIIVLLAALTFIHCGYAVAYYAYSRSKGTGNFASGFESGTLSEWNSWRAQQSCCPHSIKIVAQPVRQGQYAAKFSLYKEDPFVRGSKRTELRLKAADFGVEFQYDFSIFVPSNWVTSSVYTVIAQWHDIPDVVLMERTNIPPLVLRIKDDRFEVRVAWDSHLVTRSWYKRNSTIKDKIIWSGPLVRGRWVDWSFRIRWSPRSDGFIKAWKDRSPIFERKGPNSYNDLLGPYFKFGVYVPEWATGVRPVKVRERSVIFDAIKVRRIETVKPKT